MLNFSFKNCAVSRKCWTVGGRRGRSRALGKGRDKGG